MTKREKISRWGVLIGVAVFGFLWYADPIYSQDQLTQMLCKSLVSRVLGSLIFVSLSIFLSYRICHRIPLASLAVLLPCLAVVVNNLPILALAGGEAHVVRADLFGLFVADCLFIGIFEELAFRGTLFLAILEKRRGSTKEIFMTALISSALFGLVHLANLLEGAGVVETLMQVGYSFLIGGMCSIVLLKTKNIIPCILLHTIFDFCGSLIPTLGEGRIWNPPTVALTAVLAVAVSAWMIYVLCGVKPEDTDCFYLKKSMQKENENSNEHAEN